MSSLTLGSNNELIVALTQIVKELRAVVKRFPEPFTFLRSEIDGLSSNVSANTIIIPGNPVPRGHKGRVTDVNINFSTVAGTVKIVLLDPSGRRVADILKNISNDTNGIGPISLDEGYTIGIAGQTQAAGVFDCYCTGEIVKIGD